MNPRVIISLLAVGLIGFAIYRANPKPQPDVPDNAFTLAPAFRTNDNRAEAVRHAFTFAVLCRSLANGIEYDGTRKPSPRINTGVQIDDLRRAVREYSLNGVSFAIKYPGLASMVGEYLDAKVGKGGGTFDESKRNAWVAAFRALGAASELAAKAG